MDSLEIAQLVYLLLNESKVRNVIDTFASKMVLILGRFTEEGLGNLDKIRFALRARGYVPILFDFNKPATRDLTETISTLAHLARFVIADITDARSVPQELMRIIPNLPSVPVQPIIQARSAQYALFEHLQRFPWVLPVADYSSVHDLSQSIAAVVEPAEAFLANLVSRNVSWFT